MAPTRVDVAERSGASSRQRRFRLWGGGLVAVTLLFGACSDAQLAGIVRSPAPDVAQVSLPEASNEGRDFQTIADDNRLLLVYFGYTQCPDICPTTLVDLRNAVQDLGDDATRIDVAFVTVDPERDTDEILTSYIQAFFDNGVALRTDDPARLEAAAESFGAIYEVTKEADGSVNVGHSTLLSVIDSSGHILVQWPFGTSSQDMSNDLEILLKRES